MKEIERIVKAFEKVCLQFSRQTKNYGFVSCGYTTSPESFIRAVQKLNKAGIVHKSELSNMEEKPDKELTLKELKEFFIRKDSNLKTWWREKEFEDICLCDEIKSHRQLCQELRLYLSGNNPLKHYYNMAMILDVAVIK